MTRTDGVTRLAWLFGCAVSSICIAASYAVYAQDRAPAPAASTEVAETLHTARAVVRGGQSAGMVLKLDAKGRDGGGPLFDLDEAAGRVPPLPTLRGPAGEMLKRHVQRGRRFSTKGTVLLDSTASSCGNFLEHQISVDVSGTMLEGVTAIFNAGSGQNVPVGVVGSCGIEVAKNTADRVRLKGSYTVGEALEVAIGQLSGIVWLAVEGADGTCGVGLYGRDGLREPPNGSPLAVGDGTFCMVQIGKVP